LICKGARASFAATLPHAARPPCTAGVAAARIFVTTFPPERRFLRSREEGTTMLGFIWFIIMGGVIGWLASMVMKRDASMGTIANIVVGIVGSFIGNSLLGFVFGGGTIGAWPPDVSGVLGALLGAVLLLGALNYFQRGKVR
jgi:uncharacterized membrane protein YeaQ/YmgE (transglycosylase-associated protein family)